MKMISSDSPFRRIPIQSDSRQKLYLDGIRYSIEMADLAYKRLRNTLLDISINMNTTNEEDKGDRIVSATLDCWSIIDSIHRLRGLLRQTPKIKHKDPNIRLFLQKTASIEDLRNAMQHLNHNIDNLLREQRPILGVISWTALLDPSSKIAYSYLLVPGAIWDRKPDNAINLLGETVEAPIGLITLTASGYTTCVSHIMDGLLKLVEYLELQISHQFTGPISSLSDAIIGLEIKFLEEPKIITKEE
jgi:hypothetical protein